MDLELSLSDYWLIARKRKGSSLLVFLLSLAGGITYTNLQAPVFRAQAILKFEPPLGKLSAGDLMALGPVLQTQVSLLMSMDMAARIARKMNWSLEKAQRCYRGEKMGQSALISLVAFSEDPSSAAALANLIADTFIEWDLETRSRQTRRTLDDVTARRGGVEEKLRRLEGQRKEFLEKHETAGLGSTLAMSLLDLDSRKKELLKRFTEEHPEVKKITQRIELMRRQVSLMPAEQEELMGLQRDIKVQEETYIALSRQMEESRIALESTLSYLTVMSRATAPSRPHSPNKPMNHLASAVLGLFLALLSAVLLESLDISITTLEEIEKVLEAPVLGIVPQFGSPNRWQNLLVTVLRKERHSEDSFRNFLVFRHPPKSPHIEVYHGLRINIQAQVPRPENMVLTFTSTGVAEGKTLTAVNFAMAAAHSGLKTLLIGADLRRPNLHRIFGLQKEPGFIEALTGRVPWQQAVRKTVDILMGEADLERLSAFPGIDNFKIMVGWASSTAELVNLFQSHRLPKLIAELRANFDLIIFDCPPVLLFVDAMLIGQHTDGVILVYKSGKMARRALKRARDQIVVSKGKILGIVLNGARAADMGPGYGYYADYGHYSKPPDEQG